jgi:myo-inositol-1(or 4)-monophosphatase
LKHNKKQKPFLKLEKPVAPMTKWNPGQILFLLLKSGETAMKYFSLFRWKIKSDKSLVTEADTAIESMLAGYFDHPASDTFMIGEESADLKDNFYFQTALKKTCWLIDPIDGTAPFACNIPTWGISIGFAEKGILKHGAIFLPTEEELYITIGNSTYMADNVKCEKKNGVVLRKIKKNKSNFANGGMVSVSQDIAKKGCIHLSNPVQAICSTVFSVAGLLRGRYSAYIASSKLWDLAAGIPLLLPTGFRVVLRNGGNVGRKISGDTSFLPPAKTEKRWKYKDNLIISNHKNIIESVRKTTHLPR